MAVVVTEVGLRSPVFLKGYGVHVSTHYQWELVVMFVDEVVENTVYFLCHRFLVYL